MIHARNESNGVAVVVMMTMSLATNIPEHDDLPISG
jgi:hypothetical protein